MENLFSKYKLIPLEIAMNSDLYNTMNFYKTNKFLLLFNENNYVLFWFHEPIKIFELFQYSWFLALKMKDIRIAFSISQYVMRDEL